MPRHVCGNLPLERVIAEVKKYSFLYDPGDPQYKDLLKKAEAWRDIGRKLNQDPETVKMKWRNCRDAYLKHKRTVIGNKTQSVIRYKSWPWNRHMRFMDRILEVRPPKSSGPASSETVAGNSKLRSEQRAASEGPSSPGSSSSDAESPSQDDCAENILLPSTSTQMRQPPRKMRKDGMCDHCVVSYLENKQTSEDKHDEIDHLFLSYAKTFKRFTVRSQAKLKVQLAQLFAEVELAELDTQRATQMSSSVSVKTPPCTDLTEPPPASDVTPVSTLTSE